MSRKRPLDALPCALQPFTFTSKRRRTSSFDSSLIEPVQTIAVYLDHRADAPYWLSKQQLSQQCVYFAKFDRSGWPRAFRLHAAKDREFGILDPVSDLDMDTMGTWTTWEHGIMTDVRKDYTENEPHQVGDPESDTSEQELSLARKLHGYMFSLLGYNIRQERNEDGKSFAKQLRDTALLARSYGCMDAVKDGLLISAWSTEVHAIKLLQHAPLLLLHLASLLRDKLLHQAALRHAAGQRAAAMEDDTDLPKELNEVVDQHARLISESVSKTCKMLSLSSMHTMDLSGFIAWSLFHQHLLERVLPTSTAGKDRFRELFYIYNLETGLDLTGTQQATRILRAARVIDLGMIQASNALADLESELREDREQELGDLEAAIEEKLNQKSIRMNMKDVVRQAQRVLKPLFSGEGNGQYFMHLDFGDGVPWEADEEVGS